MALVYLKKTRYTLRNWATLAVFGAALSACASNGPVATPASEASATSTPTSSPTNTSGAQVTPPSGLDKLFGFISPYRITIQQGNFVSQEMMTQVKEGMTREQIRQILGTALLTDMFHEDRWDYPFRLIKPNGEVVASRVAIYFKNNTVERFEGGNLPTEKEYLAHIATSAIATRNDSAPLSDSPKKK